MTKIQILTKFTGTLILFYIQQHLNEVNGWEWDVFFCFMLLHFMWFNGWDVYTERSRKKMDNGAQAPVLLLYLSLAMSHYKIKLDDKAAFLNRLEKQDVRVDSYDIADNKLKGYFEIDVTDEQANTIIKSILKSSPKINTVKEMKTKITKSQLAEIIREEMGKMKGQQAKPEMDESAAEIMQWISDNGQVLSTLGTLIGITGSAVGAAIASQFKAAKAENPDANFRTLVSKAAGKVLGAADAATGTNTPGQGIGGNR